MLDIDEPKKKRVNKACDSCRMKKTKCDGLKPCSKCTQDNKLCTYSEKRKQAEKTYSSNYVELLESRIEILQSSLQKLVVKIARGEDVKQFVPDNQDILSINKVIELLQADSKSSSNRKASSVAGASASRGPGSSSTSAQKAKASIPGRPSLSSIDTMSAYSDDDDIEDDFDGSQALDDEYDEYDTTQDDFSRQSGDYFSPELKLSHLGGMTPSDRPLFGAFSPESVLASPPVMASNSGPSVLEDDLNLDLGLYTSGAALAAAALKGDFFSGLSNLEDSGVESTKDDPLGSPVPWGTISPAALEPNPLTTMSLSGGGFPITTTSSSSSITTTSSSSSIITSTTAATPASSIHSLDTSSSQTSLSGASVYYTSGAVNHLSKVHKAGGSTQGHHHHHSTHSTHSPTVSIVSTLAGTASIPITAAAANNPYYIRDARSRRRDRSLSKASVNRLPRNRSVDDSISPTSSMASSVAHSPKTSVDYAAAAVAAVNSGSNGPYISSSLRHGSVDRRAEVKRSASTPSGNSGGTSISSVNTDSSSVSRSPRSSSSVSATPENMEAAVSVDPSVLDEQGNSLLFGKPFVQMEDLQSATDRLWLNNL